MSMNRNPNLRPDSVLAEVMPDWNGSESIVGYIIRNRNAKREQEARRARLVRRACLLANVLWPCAALVAVLLTQPLILAALNTARP